MNLLITKSIKIISTVAITFFLGLAVWNLYLHYQDKSLSPGLIPLFWLGNLALVAHSIEGLIAASKANTQDKNPLIYGIYTFFVGFVGLKELADN